MKIYENPYMYIIYYFTMQNIFRINLKKKKQFSLFEEEMAVAIQKNNRLDRKRRGFTKIETCRNRGKE